MLAHLQSRLTILSAASDIVIGKSTLIIPSSIFAYVATAFFDLNGELQAKTKYT